MNGQSLNFTKRVLVSLPIPDGGKRSTYHDSKISGLSLRITHNGTKTFILRRRIQGRSERITLGQFPDLTIEQARKLATQLNGLIASGINPNDQKRALRAEITLGELFQTYLERHAKQHKKSWRYDQAQFERYLHPWRNRRLSLIKKSDIQTLHTRIGNENGPYAANRLLALLHGLYERSRDWGWEGDNPTKGIRKYKEVSRERFLQADELPRFFMALAEESNTTIRDYILISLLTGARRSNVLAMCWQDINLERGTWTIPDTKSGTPHTLPLVSQALRILETRLEHSSDDKWVFPSTGKTGHLVEPKKAWARLLERADLKGLRLHDLRRSLGSWQAATGANLSIIGKSLAHKNVSTTAIYARLNIDPVRDAMEKATLAMFEAKTAKSDNKGD